MFSSVSTHFISLFCLSHCEFRNMPCPIYTKLYIQHTYTLQTSEATMRILTKKKKKKKTPLRQCRF